MHIPNRSFRMTLAFWYSFSFPLSFYDLSSLLSLFLSFKYNHLVSSKLGLRAGGLAFVSRTTMGSHARTPVKSGHKETSERKTSYVFDMENGERHSGRQYRVTSTCMQPWAATSQPPAMAAVNSRPALALWAKRARGSSSGSPKREMVMMFRRVSSVLRSGSRSIFALTSALATSKVVAGNVAGTSCRLNRSPFPSSSSIECACGFSEEASCLKNADCRVNQQFHSVGTVAKPLMVHSTGKNRNCSLCSFGPLSIICVGMWKSSH